MNKIAALALENLWLILAVVTLAGGIYESVRNGLRKGYVFFILFAVSLIMYIYRRNRRIHFSQTFGGRE